MKGLVDRTHGTLVRMRATLCAVGLALAGAVPVAHGQVAASVAGIVGSGHVVDEVRPVTGFTRIVVASAVDVTFKNAAAEKVTVTGDDNLVPLIETRVEKGSLIVGVRAGAVFTTRNKLEVRVEGRQLDAVTVRASGDLRADHVKAAIFETTIHGSGSVSIGQLDAGTVAVSVSGSGDFRAGGRTTQLGIVIAGSGEVQADELESRDAAVRIRGSGSARVFARETLQVDIAGSGDVLYRGEPKVTRKVAGSGEVAPLR